VVELAVIPARAVGLVSRKTGTPQSRANAFTSLTNRFPIRPINAGEGIGWPRCRVMNRTI
jgi:hypothetical protein